MRRKPGLEVAAIDPLIRGLKVLQELIGAVRSGGVAAIDPLIRGLKDKWKECIPGALDAGCSD